MSIWTHVAGVIRIDGFPDITDQFEDEATLDRAVGKVLSFYDDVARWDDADEHPYDYMPCGSEGSLERSLWTNPDPSQMARWTLTVFGDLRDYDDVNAIIEWFKNRCAKIHSDAFTCASVRNAVITVECEDGNWAVWSSDGFDEHYLANTR